MLVTPLRDGMNLVAKEFVASRTDGDGVLVLSEFAGAAWELPEALQVNPYDVDGAAEVYYRALPMPREERRARLAPLRTRVHTFDVHRWVASFLERSGRCHARRPAARRHAGRHRRPGATLASRLAETDALLLLLDYDGTLVPFTPTPELARPDARGCWRCCARSPARPDTEVHLVSGRPQDTLQAWLGDLPDLAPRRARLSLARPGHREWVPAAELGGSWREPVLAMLRETTQRTPGSLVEVKAAALAWHYRMADQETGARRANELRLHLNQLLSNQPVEILAGQPGDRDPALRRAQGPDRPAAQPRAPGRHHHPRHRRRPHRRGPLRRAAARGHHHPGRPGRHQGAIPARRRGRRAASCCGRWSRRGVAAVPGSGRPEHARVKHHAMRIETLAVHAGHTADPATGAVNPPIHLTTTFAPRRRRHAAARLHLRAERQPDPAASWSARLAALEGGETAIAFASGMAATAAVFQSMLPGEHVVAPQDAYYGTGQAAARGDGGLGTGEHAGGHDRSPRGGRGGAAATPGSSGSRRRPTPRSPSPTSRGSRRSPARPARAASATTPGPRRVLQRPLALGCDLVMHSTTKYLGGHSDLTGGALVSPGGRRLGGAAPHAAGARRRRCPRRSTAGC